MVEFPISGVETYWWLPGLVAFLISSFTSTGGLSGAFILVPFQVSVLGYTTPGASPTSLLFNVIAIPSGVIRLHREGRMLWSLAWLTGIGTIPGLVLGAYLRVEFLPDPRSFKLFAGLVLLYLGIKLVLDILARRTASGIVSNNTSFRVSSLSFTKRELRYSFNGREYAVNTLPLLAVSLVVGVIGGAYGFGGGAFLSPFLVAIYQLPVQSISGAMLLGTFLTSVVGVVVYFLFALYGGQFAAGAMPDWWLGLSFGIGGALGVYLGSRLQKHVPTVIIKAILICALLFIAGKYILAYFG
jgi:hypothetical protein